MSSYSRLNQDFSGFKSSSDPYGLDALRTVANDGGTIGRNIQNQKQEDGRMKRLAGKAYREAARGGDPSSFIQAYKFMQEVRAGGGTTGAGIGVSGQDTGAITRNQLYMESQVRGRGPMGGLGDGKAGGGLGSGAAGSGLSGGGLGGKASGILSAPGQKRSSLIAPSSPTEAGESQSVPGFIGSNDAAKSILDNYSSGGITREQAFEQGRSIGGQDRTIGASLASVDSANARSVLESYGSGKISREEALAKGTLIGGTDKTIGARLDQIDQKNSAQYERAGMEAGDAVRQEEKVQTYNKSILDNFHKNNPEVKQFASDVSERKRLNPRESELYNPEKISQIEKDLVDAQKVIKRKGNMNVVEQPKPAMRFSLF